jgi:hypothetical protein
MIMEPGKLNAELQEKDETDPQSWIGIEAMKECEQARMTQ